VPPFRRLFLTRVHAHFPCDVHFPDLAPLGLPLHSPDRRLEGLIAPGLRLVETTDRDVQTGRRFQEGGIEFTFHVYTFVQEE
jgi:hypothetical protein